MPRATCRSRRATRWRSTAEPTALPITSPTRGAVPSSGSLPRRTWMMTSGCTMRIPRFTAASNSVDRLMRLRAGSTAGKPDVAIRQITRGGPYGADWTRWNARHGYASASGSHARGLGAGYSAGRSACPWPRRSPRCVCSHCRRPLRVSISLVCGLAGRWSCCWPARSPGTSRSQPYRRLSGDCLRVLTRLRRVKPGLPQRTRSGRTQALAVRPHLGPARLGRQAEPGPSYPKQPDWNAAERLAAARKTVSFCQGRFRLKRRSTTKRGWWID